VEGGRLTRGDSPHVSSPEGYKVTPAGDSPSRNVEFLRMGDPAVVPKKVWVISELYYPEETSTGYFVTKIAEGLSRDFPTHALCSQPTYSARGISAPSQEVYNDVVIRRCRATTLNKDILLFRLVNMLTISLSMFLHAVCSFRRGDIVLVATNPPMLPFLIAGACRIRGAKCVLLVQDVYPESLVAAGLLDPHSFFVSVLNRLNLSLYRAMERISVVGRDMEVLVRKKLANGTSTKIVIIRNWADVDQIAPSRRDQNELLKQLGLNGKFVAQFAGNIGRVQGIETLLETAKILRGIDNDIHFLFIGSGAKKRWLEDAVKGNGLNNVTILPNRPRGDQQNFLNACDVAITAFVPRMTGVGVPSRMYNIFSAGKPIVAAVEEDSELGLVVREDNVGWIVPLNDAKKMAAALLEAKKEPDLLADMGIRARAIAVNKYAITKVIDAYRSMVGELLANSSA
jgi:glycosyltransferase involved in cell wall biosynthesis